MAAESSGARVLNGAAELMCVFRWHVDMLTVHGWGVDMFFVSRSYHRCGQQPLACCTTWAVSAALWIRISSCPMVTVDGVAAHTAIQLRRQCTVSSVLTDYLATSLQVWLNCSTCVVDTCNHRSSRAVADLEPHSRPRGTQPSRQSLHYLQPELTGEMLMSAPA